MPNLAPPSEHASAPPSELWKINEDLYSRTIYNGLEWYIYFVNNTCFDKITKKLFYLIFFWGGEGGGTLHISAQLVHATFHYAKSR